MKKLTAILCLIYASTFSQTSFTGLKISGQKSLSTIGSLIYWYDYRYGISLNGSSAVTVWRDLSSSGSDLIPFFPASTYATYLHTDNTVKYVADGVSRGFKWTKQPIGIESTYNGSAWMAFALVYKTPGTGDVEIYLLSNGPATGARFTLQQNDKIRAQVWNTSSSLIISATSTATISSGTWTLITVTYYGASAGSNNIKLTIGSTTENFTASPTHSTDGPRGSTVARSINSTSGTTYTTLKLNGAYDLTGKSVSEINTFRTLFFATLKEDSEYTSITTP